MKLHVEIEEVDSPAVSVPADRQLEMLWRVVSALLSGAPVPEDAAPLLARAARRAAEKQLV